MSCFILLCCASFFFLSLFFLASFSTGECDGTLCARCPEEFPAGVPHIAMSQQKDPLDICLAVGNSTFSQEFCVLKVEEAPVRLLSILSSLPFRDPCWKAVQWWPGNATPLPLNPLLDFPPSDSRLHPLQVCDCQCGCACVILHSLAHVIRCSKCVILSILKSNTSPLSQSASQCLLRWTSFFLHPASSWSCFLTVEFGGIDILLCCLNHFLVCVILM